MNLEMHLPIKYSGRMVKVYDCTINVYADAMHTVLLGNVNNQSQAMQLLDGYDAQMTRRQVIIDLLDQRAMEALRSVADDVEGF